MWSNWVLGVCLASRSGRSLQRIGDDAQSQRSSVLPVAYSSQIKCLTAVSAMSLQRTL